LLSLGATVYAFPLDQQSATTEIMRRTFINRGRELTSLAAANVYQKQKWCFLSGQGLGRQQKQ
jgi:hypothetical protein